MHNLMLINLLKQLIYYMRSFLSWFGTAIRQDGTWTLARPVIILLLMVAALMYLILSRPLNYSARTIYYVQETVENVIYVKRLMD